MSPPSRISPPPPSIPKDDPTQDPTGLTPSQLATWHKNGYLLIPNALSPTTTAALLAETRHMLSTFDLSTHPMTKFTTGEHDSNGSTKHVGDDYFLTSGDKVRFFFEEDAVSPAGALLKPQEAAVNKIGHALHVLSPAFRAVTLSPRNAAIARSLGFRDPRALQSMVICKQPGIGGAVPPHQDSTFLYTSLPSAVGWWYALEDATLGNGCLSFAPGSHRRAPVRKRFVRMDEGGTGFVDVGEEGRFPRQFDAEGEEQEQEEEYLPGEVKAGTLVLIHGNLLHKSEKNTSDKSRFIYTFHVVEGEESYDERNWLQPTSEDGFEKLFR